MELHLKHDALPSRSFFLLHCILLKLTVHYLYLALRVYGRFPPLRYLRWFFAKPFNEMNEVHLHYLIFTVSLQNTFLCCLPTTYLINEFPTFCMFMMWVGIFNFLYHWLEFLFGDVVVHILQVLFLKLSTLAWKFSDVQWMLPVLFALHSQQENYLIVVSCASSFVLARVFGQLHRWLELGVRILLKQCQLQCTVYCTCCWQRWYTVSAYRIF